MKQFNSYREERRWRATHRAYLAHNIPDRLLHNDIVVSACLSQALASEMSREEMLLLMVTTLADHVADMNKLSLAEAQKVPPVMIVQCPDCAESKRLEQKARDEERAVAEALAMKEVMQHHREAGS